jgi:hypothetical protein
MTATCPACGHKAPWRVFEDAEGCPHCERSMKNLFRVAAGREEASA